MDIALLKTFLAVHRERHFGRAARALHLTQSTVSARIALLEQRLGVRLFERDRHNIRLTPAGERFLPHVEALLANWQQAQRAVGAPAAEAGGLRVAVALGVWPLLEGALPAALAAAPEVELWVEEAQNLARRLEGGELDLLIGGLPPAEPGAVYARVLGEWRWRLGGTPSVSPAADYVLLDWGPAFLAAHRARPSPGPVRRRLPAVLAAAWLARHGGAAYWPDGLAPPHPEWRPLPDAAPVQAPLWALWRPDAARAPRVERLLERLAAPASIAVADGFDR
ncbi:MAG: HTH-type transcriptional regulator HdfR [Gammaproteobacteria bacterium]|nr:MAG: HTH-type transcriptional regulator HdfR [Gammaproteobacteria bacterium]